MGLLSKAYIVNYVITPGRHGLLLKAIKRKSRGSSEYMSNDSVNSDQNIHYNKERQSSYPPSFLKKAQAIAVRR